MLRVINGTGEIDYILTEQERASLASAEAKEFIDQKLRNIHKYEGTNIDFFTDREIEAGDEYYFNVNVNGVLYSNCVYDNEDRSGYTGLALEAYRFLVWRHSFGGSSSSYTETVGNYIEDGKVYTVEDTEYNDCVGYEPYMREGCTVENMPLDDFNREVVRHYMLSL